MAAIERVPQHAETPAKFQLAIANRLWGQTGYDFLPEFLSTTEQHYGAGLMEVDFISAPDAAAATINSWVDEKTAHKIVDLIPMGVITEDTRLVLTNAIYFKAAWLHPFSPQQTVDGEF